MAVDNMDYGNIKMSLRQLFHTAMDKEIERAYEKHGTELWGRHEFYGILKEEVDELWDAIKINANSDKLAEEMIQVAAMCLRYYETGNRYSDGMAL